MKECSRNPQAGRIVGVCLRNQLGVGMSRVMWQRFCTIVNERCDNRKDIAEEICRSVRSLINDTSKGDRVDIHMCSLGYHRKEYCYDIHNEYALLLKIQGKSSKSPLDFCAFSIIKKQFCVG